MNPPEQVTCRIKPYSWWLVAYCLGTAAFLLTGSVAIARTPLIERSDWVLFAFCCFLGVLSLYAAGYYALFLLWGFVQADATGLCWRTVGKIREVSWDEVTNFYDTSPFPRDARKFAVETRAGTLKLSAHWTNTAVLRDFIKSHATKSQSRTWMLHHNGTKWPRVFHYRGWGARWFIPIITACGILVWPCAHGIILFRPEKVRSEFADLGLLLGILLTIGKLGFIFVVPVLYVLIFWPLLRDLRHRRNEQITATPNGLIFEDGMRRIESRWDEITNFYITPSTDKLNRGNHIVETPHGNFDFLQELEPYQGLQELIEERATNSAVREWNRHSAKEVETRGGEAAKWRNGQRVHSYRTHSIRFLLWIPMIFGGFLPIVAWLQFQGFYQTPDAPSVESNGPIGILIVALGFLIAASLGWWAYYRLSIRTDDQGLTQTGWRGEKFVAWEDITDFYRDSGSSYIVSKNGARLRFGSNIADVEELRQTITERSGREASNGT